MNDNQRFLGVEDRSQMDEQKMEDVLSTWKEEDRAQREQDERRCEAKAADILIHLQRMRNARLRLAREPQSYHVSLGEHYRAMARVIDLLDDFRIEGWTVPDFVQEQWDSERKQDLARRAA
jgi:hypothetical protein